MLHCHSVVINRRRVRERTGVDSCVSVKGQCFRGVITFLVRALAYLEHIHAACWQLDNSNGALVNLHIAFINVVIVVRPHAQYLVRASSRDYCLNDLILGVSNAARATVTHIGAN